MTKYLAIIRTATACADRLIDAANADEALARAQQLARTGWRNLNFVPYRNRPCIERIEIRAPGGKLAGEWTDRDVPLREAASDMLAALELCEDVLSELARLDDGTPSISALDAARAAIAKAREGAA